MTKIILIYKEFRQKCYGRESTWTNYTSLIRHWILRQQKRQSPKERYCLIWRALRVRSDYHPTFSKFFYCGCVQKKKEKAGAMPTEITTKQPVPLNPFPHLGYPNGCLDCKPFPCVSPVIVLQFFYKYQNSKLKKKIIYEFFLKNERESF